MRHIYITGCPRSGTTMLASMLGNQSNCVVTPESDFFTDFIFKYFKNKSETVETSKYLDFISKNYRFKQWSLDALKIENIPKKINYQNLNAIIERTVELFARENPEIANEEFFRIDHTPSNIKYFDILNDFSPDSKFIFIVRDPRAVFASVKKLDWGSNTALRLSEIWSEYSAIYFSLKKLYPNRICLVRYEDIITNSLPQLKMICSFSGITYNDLMLEGKGFRVPDYTAAQHDLIGKKLDKNRIKKWKNELTTKEKLIIEAKCKHLMSAFDYKASINVNYRVNVNDKINMMFNEVYYYVKNKIRKKKREKKT